MHWQDKSVQRKAKEQPRAYSRLAAVNATKPNFPFHYECDGYLADLRGNHDRQCLAFHYGTGALFFNTAVSYSDPYSEIFITTKVQIS